MNFIKRLVPGKKDALAAIAHQESQVIKGLLAALPQEFVLDGESFVLAKLVENADNGSLEAMNFLGDIFTLGQSGMPVNEKIGWYYYEKAAAAGSTGAAFKLGLELFCGNGYLPVNEKKGRQMLTLAADAGHRDAQYVLGDIYKSQGNQKKPLIIMNYPRSKGMTKPSMS